jgi:hypothetical protein
VREARRLATARATPHLREVAAGRRAAAALEAIHQVRAAADAGTFRPEHVVEFGHGIAKVGAEAMAAAEHLLLPVAHQCDPSVLRTAIDKLHRALDPDATTSGPGLRRSTTSRAGAADTDGRFAGSSTPTPAPSSPPC